MNKKITIIILICLCVIVLCLFGFIFYKNNNYNVKKFERVENTLSDVKFVNGTKNVYLFYGKECPHCASLDEFMETLDGNVIKNVNFYTFEVWHNDDNAKLMEDVSKRLNANANGVPFMIIGDKYFIGYSEDEEQNKEIKNAIKDYDGKKDIIKDIKNES